MKLVQWVTNLRIPFKMFTSCKSEGAICQTVGVLLRTNSAHILMTITGAFLSFLPILAGSRSYIEPTSLGATLRGDKENQLSIGVSWVCLVLAILLGMDMLIDSLISYVSNRVNAEKRKKNDTDNSGGEQSPEDPSFNNLEKTLFIVAVILAPSCILSPGSTPRLALLYSCALKCQITLIFGAVASSMTRYNERYFPGWLTFVNIILVALGNILGCYTTNQAEFVVASPLNIFRLVSSLGAGLVLVIQCVIWLSVAIIVRINKGHDKSEVFEDAVDGMAVQDSRLILQAVHSLFYFAYFASMIYITTLGSIIAADDTKLFTLTVIYVSYEMALTLFSMRLVKYKVVQGLVSTSCNYDTLRFAFSYQLTVLIYRVKCCCPIGHPAERQEAICAVHLP